MGQRINDLKSLSSIPLDGNFAVDTSSSTGKVSVEDLRTFMIDGIPFKFGIDDDGNYGYIKDGADTVTPFKSQADIDEAYAEGAASITDDPQTLALSATSGDAVPVTPGYYNAVNTTVLYDAAYDAGETAGAQAADEAINTESASYAAGYSSGVVAASETVNIYSASYAAGIASITDNPQKLTLDGTNGSNVDITDAYYSTVDTTAVYSAGAASITSNPAKLTLGTTNGANVDIIDGYYGTVDTTALYSAAYDAGYTDGGNQGGGSGSGTGVMKRVAIGSAWSGRSQSWDVSAYTQYGITAANFGLVPSNQHDDTSAGSTYSGGSISLSGNTVTVGAFGNGGVHIYYTLYLWYQDNTAQKLTLTTTNGTNVDIDDGYYGTVDTTAVYEAGYDAGYTAGQSAGSRGLADTISINYKSTLKTTASATDGSTTDRAATGTAVFKRQSNGSYSLQSGGSTSTTKNNYSANLPMWGVADITGISVVNDNNTINYDASGVLKATISNASTSGSCRQSYTATQKCIAIASSAGFEGGFAAVPTTTGTVISSYGNLMVALLEEGQTITVNGSCDAAYEGATTTLVALAVS